MSDINEEAVTKAAELVNANFPTAKAVGVKCDVSKEADVKAMIDRAVSEFGRLDVLVCRLTLASHARDLGSEDGRCYDGAMFGDISSGRDGKAVCNMKARQETVTGGRDRAVLADRKRSEPRCDGCNLGRAVAQGASSSPPYSSGEKALLGRAGVCDG